MDSMTETPAQYSNVTPYNQATGPVFVKQIVIGFY